MATDPYYSSVSLLMQDGTENAQGHVVTLAGGAAVTSSVLHFGLPTIRLEPSHGSYLSIPNSAVFDFGAGDFTIELWVAISAVSSYGGALIGSWGSGPSTNPNWLIYVSPTRAVTFYAAVTPVTGESPALSGDGSFNHIALTRQGSTVRLFVDGVQVAAATYSLSIAYAAGQPVRMGIWDDPLSYVSGNFGGVRITKGVARDADSFAALTEKFPNFAEITALAAASSMLGKPAAFSVFGGALFARASAKTPLGAVAAVASQSIAASLSARGPLATVSALARAVLCARTGAAGPLSRPLVIVRLSLIASLSAPSILAAPTALAVHDFTGKIGDAATFFVMDLITPTGAVRIPISSWQATLQTGSSNYVQCVIPACTIWASAINSATEFAIYRRAVLPDGTAIEYEMARAPAEQPQFDRGPQRHTCTLSGYSDAFAASEDPPATYDRSLTGVRSISSGSSYRVRCAVDWLLRPGHRAFVEGAPFVVKFINYYAPSGFDSYMDVGG